MKKLSLLILFSFCFSQAQTYSDFQEQVKAQSEKSRQEGMSMLLSGGLAFVGGAYGWSSAKKPVEKAFYSIAQSLGLLAIGYGAEAYYLKQDDEIFLQVLTLDSLTSAQKDQMVQSYLRERKDREESLVWIRRVSFGLSGLLNLVEASQVKDQTLQNFLYVTAGVQLVWAFTF